MPNAEQFYEGPLLHISNLNIAVSSEGATLTVLQTSPALDGQQPILSRTRPVAQFFATPLQMSNTAVLMARLSAAWMAQYSPDSSDDFLNAVTEGIAEGHRQGQESAATETRDGEPS